MATTTNYGWGTPDDTDLVKDGALAIRDLGQDIDTTTKALNPETTTGDIAYRSATANTNTRLALGTAGQVLTVNSGATAPEWAAAAGGGGMTLLSTTTLSGTSTSISITPTGYNSLEIHVNDFQAGSDYSFNMIFNNNTTLNNYFGVFNEFRAVGSNALTGGSGDSSIGLSYYDWKSGDQNNYAVINVYDPNSTTSNKTVRVAQTGLAVGGANYWYARQIVAAFNDTSAISSVQFRSNQSLNGGTVKIYGVK
jgi:hypothetical protein